jgi:hypothetical protein
MVSQLELLVSVGHGEYLPAGVAELTASLVWDPYTDDNIDHTADPDQALARYREVVGADPTGDWDLTWETVQRWTGPRSAVDAALGSLLDKIAAAPSGDDDTYDYWPSGVRLALQVAEALGGDRVAQVQAAARGVLQQTGMDADEVRLSGLLDPEDEAAYQRIYPFCNACGTNHRHGDCDLDAANLPE